MANLRNGTFGILASREVEEGSNLSSISTSPYRTDAEYKDALVHELRLSADLSDRLRVLVRNGSRYHRQQILNLHNHDCAHALLNHLQAWLDFFPQDDLDRRRVLYILIRFIHVTEEYPSNLYLNNVEKTGATAFSKGAHSLLYHGHMNMDSGKRWPVTLKKPTVEGEKVETAAAMLKDFVREAIVWRQLRHQHVHPLLGLYQEPGNKSVIYGVSEYCRFQTLYHYVHGISENILEGEKYSPTNDCVRLLGEIADGLVYLHSLKIVHCDLKPVNIVVDNQKRARILDFGSNVIGEATSGKPTGPEGLNTTVQWQPPEALEESTYQRPRASFDVYSFACICYSISMGFPNIFNDIAPKNEFRIPQKIDKGIRPTWNQSRTLDVDPRIGIRPSNGMWSLVICPGWAQNELHRPDMETIRNYFVRERRRMSHEDYLFKVQALENSDGQTPGELPFRKDDIIRVVGTPIDPQSRCWMAKSEHSVQGSVPREKMYIMHMFMARAIRESNHCRDGKQDLRYRVGELIRVLKIVSDEHDWWLAVNDLNTVGEVKSSDFSLEEIETSPNDGYVGQKRKFRIRYSLVPSPSLSAHHVMSCQGGEYIEALQEPDFATEWMAARKWNGTNENPVQIIPTDFVYEQSRGSK